MIVIRFLGRAIDVLVGTAGIVGGLLVALLGASDVAGGDWWGVLPVVAGICLVILGCVLMDASGGS